MIYRFKVQTITRVDLDMFLKHLPKGWKVESRKKVALSEEWWEDLPEPRARKRYQALVKREGDDHFQRKAYLQLVQVRDELGLDERDCEIRPLEPIKEG